MESLLGMNSSPIQSDPSFLPASLAASSTGTWEYDVVHDRLRYCPTFAVLYGLPPEQRGEGVPMDRINAAAHPNDRARGRAKRMHVLQHGGAFVLEYRVLSSPQVTRWVLVRGFYEADATGRVVRGRGIAVDVTEGKEEGFAGGDVFFVTDADDRTVSALDRATKHVLAARQALGELGHDRASRLQVVADALLIEIAQHIAGTMVPVTPSRTEH